jgi:origin recognition complex subunit 4
MAPGRKPLKTKVSSSPDPLQLSEEQISSNPEPGEDINYNPLPGTPGIRLSLQSRNTTPRQARSKPIVEIASPHKRRATNAANEERPNKRVRTPLSRAQGGSNRATPTPKGKSVVIKPQDGIDSKDSENPSPLKFTETPQTPVPASKVANSRSTTKKTLGSSVKKPLPTPAKPPLPNFDDAFLDEPTIPTESAVSREAFLTNEALRRQREARNFVFEGDINAVRSTRSGRVVVPAEQGDDHKDDDEDTGGDEYGGDEDIREDPERDMEEEDQQISYIPEVIFRSNPPTPSKPKPAKTIPVLPLPVSARKHVLDILATLTSVNIARNPPPFADEESNEALQGLVGLLRGTVERGEGNSALVVGARGVGKTRVGLLTSIILVPVLI